MTDTLKELKARLKGEYADIEVYRPMSIGDHYPNHFHTDNCKYTEDFNDDSEIGLYELMDEDDYNNSIYANCADTADFAELYGDRSAKVLVCMLAEE